MRQKNSSDNSWGSLKQNKIMTISITATMLRDCFISNSLRFQKRNKNKPRYRKKTSEQNLLQKKNNSINDCLINDTTISYLPQCCEIYLFQIHQGFIHSVQFYKTRHNKKKYFIVVQHFFIEGVFVTSLTSAQCMSL